MRIPVVPGEGGISEPSRTGGARLNYTVILSFKSDGIHFPTHIPQLLSIYLADEWTVNDSDPITFQSPISASKQASIRKECLAR